MPIRDRSGHIGMTPEERKLRTSTIATHVIIGGIVFLWKDKAPYVRSGHSILGGLEYNQEVDRIKCHDCGQWFRLLGSHLVGSEGVTPTEYKREHGLRFKTPLVPFGMLQNMRRLTKKRNQGTMKPFQKGFQAPKTRNPATMAPGHAETRNLRMLCLAQIKVRLTNIVGKLERIPTGPELRVFGLPTHSIVTAFNLKNMGEVWKEMGYNTSRINRGGKTGTMHVMHKPDVPFEGQV